MKGFFVEVFFRAVAGARCGEKYKITAGIKLLNLQPERPTVLKSI